MSATSPPDAGRLRQLPRSERVEKVFGFSPFDYQKRILDSDTKETIVVCGRQVGKTETASVIPADFALTHAGEDVMIAARFQETADELFRRTKQHFSNTGLSNDAIGITKANQSTYEFDNGARILSRTLGRNADQVRGQLPRCIVVEEAALVDTDVYEKVIEPMFATHDEYELYLISTPRGKRGYLWETWNEEDNGWTKIRVPTSESPLVDDEWIQERREKVDEITFRQEYLGEFVEEGDSYLPYSLVDPCVQDGATAGEDLKTTPRTERWLGVDVARKGSDRTVYTGIDQQGRVFLLDSEDTSSMPSVAGRIKSLHDEYGFTSVLIDENAVGGGVADISTEDLGGVINPVTFTSKSKQEMYQGLKTAFEEQNLTLPDNDYLVHELTSLQFDFTRHGILRVQHAPGEHDDYPDSLALANYGRLNMKPRTIDSTWSQ